MFILVCLGLVYALRLLCIDILSSHCRKYLSDLSISDGVLKVFLSIKSYHLQFAIISHSPFRFLSPLFFSPALLL